MEGHSTDGTWEEIERVVEDGDTNLHRFRHGWMLLEMAVVGLLPMEPPRA